MMEVRRGVSVLQQMAHPGSAIADPLHAAIQWRLLFPLIGHLLGLPPFALFALAPLGCLLTLAFIVTVLRRRGLGWGPTCAAALVLGATSWFFTSVSWLGYYDSWLVLALLIVAFARSEWAVWLACLWAPWVDERFVVGALLALLCRQLPPSPAPRAGWRRTWGPPLALLALFAAVRLFLLAPHTAALASPGGYWTELKSRTVPAGRYLFGAWAGLRLAWFFVLAAVVFLRRTPSRAALVAAAALAVLVIGLGTAQDLSRSMMMEMPVALLGVLPATEAAASPCRRALPAVAGLALLLPAHHVMTDRVNPVFYLYHEIAALKNPPAAAMPEIYELRGMLEMQQGDYGSAEADFSLAIKLGDRPSIAYQQRGLLRATEGRLIEARQDFTAATRFAPRDPDGWFFRAHADLALGDTAGAVADLQQAQALGSDRWKHRPDVVQFSQAVSRRAGGF